MLFKKLLCYYYVLFKIQIRCNMLTTRDMRLNLVTTKLFFDKVNRVVGCTGVGTSFIAELLSEDLEDTDYFPDPQTLSYIFKNINHPAKYPAKFVINSQNNRSVVTSVISLEAFRSNGQVLANISQLPVILADMIYKLKTLTRPAVNIQAIQFPVELKLKFLNFTLRSHTINLVIYKNSFDNIRTLFIESTRNPFGVSSQFSLILDDVQTELNTVLASHNFQKLLRELFHVNQHAKIITEGYIYSAIQASIPFLSPQPDKRCALFAMNLAAYIVNYCLTESDNKFINLDKDIITQLSFTAHKEVSDLPQLTTEDLGITQSLIYKDPIPNLYQSRRLTVCQQHGYGTGTNAGVIKKALADINGHSNSKKSDYPALKSLITSLYSQDKSTISQAELTDMAIVKLYNSI